MASEEGRLHLGGRPVDLVRQDHLGEDGSWDEDEAPLPVDLASREVLGEEVRGELDALVGEAARPGQALREEGLAQARHPFQEGVPPGEEDGEEGLYDLLLAEEGFPQGFPKPVQGHLALLGPLLDDPLGEVRGDLGVVAELQGVGPRPPVRPGRAL